MPTTRRRPGESVIGFTHAKLARLETASVDGCHELGATTIIITAGVGYSIVPFHYAAPRRAWRAFRPACSRATPGRRAAAT